MKKILIVLILFIATSCTSWSPAPSESRTPANVELLDEPGLDPSYDTQDVGQIRLDAETERLYLVGSGKTAHDIIAQQSSVKSQDKQSVCSIFSTTGLLENKLIRAGSPMDVSEQWLIYLTAGQKGQYGVSALDAAVAYSKYGFVKESVWPFNGSIWDESSVSQTKLFQTNWAKKRCKHTKEDAALFKKCLIGQRDSRLLTQEDSVLSDKKSIFYDTDFLNIRRNAIMALDHFKIAAARTKSQKEILTLLDRGEAVILDVNFYFESWNHGRAPKMGLERNLEMWDAGIVSYPHSKSMDYKISKNVAGHSVIIVGYNRDQVIERVLKDTSGKEITVKTTGVYYFKNSWGTSGFGKNFKIDGQAYPGYGMLPMSYAHEHGRFTKMSVTAL